MQSGEEGSRTGVDASSSAAPPPRKKKIKKRKEKPSSLSATAGGGSGSDDLCSARGKSIGGATSTATAVTSVGAVSNINNAPSSSSNNHGPANLHATSGKEGKDGKDKKHRKQRRQQPNAAVAGTSSTAASRVNGSNGGEQATVLDAAQQAVNDQMRRALEEDQYSAVGSIVDGADSEEEDLFLYRGQPLRLDRAAMIQAAKKMAYYYWYPHQQQQQQQQQGSKKSLSQRHLIYPDFMSQMMNGGDAYDDADGDDIDEEDEEEDDYMDGDYDREHNLSSKESGRSKKKRKKDMGRPSLLLGVAPVGVADVASSVNAGGVVGGAGGLAGVVGQGGSSNQNRDSTMDFFETEEDLERDGGSIFGQTTGATNSTWVQCDKCKKWRRLRGVVDEKKLPPKWFCSMNRNDPERARCSAPEEDYDAQQTPESAADARTRKHLRVWVRRLQCQEAYEARQPTLTRGKKRAAASSMKDPYEWVRCCNPSCGKWRAVLRFMDAKSSVMDRVASTANGGKKEWYCVMNTWDEKMASCAAPQENLPAIGCPSWVLQDEEGDKE